MRQATSQDTEDNRGQKRCSLDVLLKPIQAIYGNWFWCSSSVRSMGVVALISPVCKRCVPNSKGLESLHEELSMVDDTSCSVRREQSSVSAGGKRTSIGLTYTYICASSVDVTRHWHRLVTLVMSSDCSRGFQSAKRSVPLLEELVHIGMIWDSGRENT